MAAIKDFITHHYRHFNAAVVIDAAQAYVDHLEKGGKMFVTLAGAMSTAELGLSLAEMVRQEKLHGICSTGANLEEDVFNLVAHNHYKRVPNYRNLSDAEEQALLESGLNRVTDTCIPEEEAIRRIDPFPNLFFLPGGKSQTGPADLFNTNRWFEVTEAIKRQFTFFVIDAPPAGVFADFDLIQAQVDGVVLVVREDHTNRMLWMRAIESMRMPGMITSGE